MGSKKKRSLEWKSLDTLLKEKEKYERENSIENSSITTFEDYLRDEIHRRGNDLFKRGVNELKNDAYLESIGFFLAVLALIPEHVKAMNNLAIAYYKLGKKESAIEILKNVLRLDPKNETAIENLEIIKADTHG